MILAQFDDPLLGPNKEGKLESKIGVAINKISLNSNRWTPSNQKKWYQVASVVVKIQHEAFPPANISSYQVLGAVTEGQVINTSSCTVTSHILRSTVDYPISSSSPITSLVAAVAYL